MGNQPTSKNERSNSSEDLQKNNNDNVENGVELDNNVRRSKKGHQRSVTLPEGLISTRPRPLSFVQAGRRFSFRSTAKKADTISSTTSTTGETDLGENQSVYTGGDDFCEDIGTIASNSPPPSPMMKPHTPGLPMLSLDTSFTFTNNNNPQKVKTPQTPAFAHNLSQAKLKPASSSAPLPSIPPPTPTLNTKNLLGHDDSIDMDPTSQKSSLCSQDCTQIRPYLYLAGDLVAKNKQQLIDCGITHILNVAFTVCPNYFEKDSRFEYLSFELIDNASEPISHFILLAVVEIERVRKNGGVMLIHCHQGVSRSATLVIAYLMWLDGIGYEESFRFVKSKRAICNPNFGFMSQLKDWERRLQAKLSRPTLHKVAPHSERDKSLVVKPVLASYAASTGAVSPDSTTSPTNTTTNSITPSRRRSQVSRTITFATILQNGEAYLLHVPAEKTIFFWVGEHVPDLNAYSKSCLKFASWMSEYEPAFSGCSVIEVKSRDITTASPGSLEEKFWKALNEVDFAAPL